MHPVVSTPYDFAGARRRYFPVGSSFASLQKTSPDKVYSALATSFDIGVAYVFCSSETAVFALASTIPVKPSVAVEFLEQQQDAAQAEWAQ
ncbi:hypothetical protein ALON55S_07000 [Alishewanella longhuensis]